MDREEITTQAAQIIDEIGRTLEALQNTAVEIIDQVAEERAALATLARFCAPASPNGDKDGENWENIEHLYDAQPETVGAVGFSEMGRR